MKVTDTSPVQNVVASRVGESSKAPERETETVDRVSVSASSETTSQPQLPPEALSAARASIEADRAKRVQEIVSAVKSGQYYPSPQQIAQQLVSAAQLAAEISAMMKG